MDMAFTNGPMEVSSKAIGKRTKLQAMEYTPGKTVGFTKATGNKIICMDKDITSGPMVVNMKDSILTIKKKAMEFIPTPTEGVTKECGRMENSMEKVCS